MDCYEYWDWYKEMIQGRVIKKNGSIVLQDQGRNILARWDFTEAFPIKWTGPDLNASTNSVPTESFVLKVKTLTRVNNP